MALLIDKGIEQIAAMLGILKAGKFFVPIDPSYPLERMSSVVQDSQTALLIVDRRNFSTAKQITGSDCQLSALEAMLSSNQTENLCVSVLPTAFACLIYTAGSTGKPKGVIRDHRGVLHGAMLRVHSDGVSSNDRLGHITAGTANAITNSFYVLLHGATLVAFDVGKEGVTRLASWLVDAKITICLIASPLFRKLCAALTGNEKFPNLRYLRLRSDTVYQSDVDLFKRYFPPTCLLANGLALSETGPLREYQIGRDTDFPGPEVPVGYALEDKEVLLVDDNGNEVATNEIGEIVVRSKYLAAGYWNNSQLHEAKFKRDPQDPEKRLFYTGDLGLILPDGCLIHKGRKDSRIKIRGYGVDLLEVEKALRSYTGMKDIVVVSQNENSEARLVAYYTTHIESRPTVSELRQYLQNKLADYMIPSAFVNLKEIPVTPGGKIDRNALPEPDNRRPDLTGPYVLPSTEIEKRLSRIWSEVLSLDRVGVQDNFFDLGGHSLTASRLISRVLDSFQVDLPVKSLFESPTLAGFAQRVEDALHEASYGTVLPLIPVPRDESLPASFGQGALWFHDQLEPGSCAYNFIALASSLSGGLEVDILERSVNQIIDRHEVLRTVFHAVDGQPMPIILPAMRIDLQVIDVGFAVSGRTGESEVCRIAGEIAGQPFDLTKGPLLRVALLRLASGEHVLLLVVHHIVFDAWSTGIFCRELSQIYNSLKNNKPSSLPALRIQYSDFAAWQKNRLQGATLENHISYWKNQLDGLSTLRVPIARSKLESDSSGNAREQFQFPKELLTNLRGLNEQTGTTLFMVLLAAYKVALHRYTGQTDIAIGTPTAGRNHPKVEGLIGFFLNVLVLRTDLSANPTFRELLKRVRKVCVDAFTHQELPFEKIVEELRPDRDVAVNPLYQITFALQNTPKYPLDLTGVMARDLDNATGLARIFDLHLFMVEEISGLRGYVTYKTSLFQAGFIKRLISHLQNILMSIVANPDQRISDLPMLAELEKQQLLVKWNDTTRDYPKT
ncbi:MAG TPA: condensation domain-containing protein, partial [Candidatus Binatia bacterium]|nr:condensation domain-containing protein [Candidatus Binatia bacterium]